MLNFKGNFNQDEESAEPRYADKVTGAHFEYTNMCSRIDKLMQNRDLRKMKMLSVSSKSSATKINDDTKRNGQDEGLFERETSQIMSDGADT